jgi:peptidoglycan hydrolase-like amidase/peptidoglycan hydrolase CwlO-like protein
MSARPKKLSTKNTLLLIASFFLILFTLFNPAKTEVYAKDECKEIDDKDDQLKCYAKKEEETRKKLESTRSKIEETLNTLNQISSQLSVTQSQLDGIQNDINDTQKSLDEINENLKDRYQKLADKISFRNNLLRNYSKKNIVNELELFFGSNESNLTGFQLSAFIYAFNKATSKETLNIIGALNSEIKQFEENKKESEELKNQLEKAQANLLAIRNDLAIKKISEEEEKKELEEKESGYERELEELQNKILALKYSEEGGTVGDYDSPSAKTPDPPSGLDRPAFAVFSYGAYTHYSGMSQYGAKGRADSGKNYDDILKFYYGEKSTKKDNFPDEICVEGIGNMSFQEYLYGIAEMPSTWNMNALKAQAIAARSYAYRRTKNGGCICTTQSCQVFSSSKSKNPPDSWKKAVNETEKRIIGGDINRTGYGWYSSTTGGYINNVGWDVSGKWPDGAYEKKAGSPWFYKAWYTKSYSDGSTCNHPHPWLSEKEMADILNAYVVYTKGTSGEKGHITPRSDCWGGDPYSLDEMAKRADKYLDGEPYKSVSGVDVEISNSGYTSKVTFKTNRGETSFDGPTFKTVFNLRSPGYVAIRSKLFDFKVEK